MQIADAQVRGRQPIAAERVGESVGGERDVGKASVSPRIGSGHHPGEIQTGRMVDQRLEAGAA